MADAEFQLRPSFRTTLLGKVRFNVAGISNCPCGSRRPFIQCCRVPDGWATKKASTTPRPPNTGATLARCYAACLNDCGNAISREHFISKSILACLANSGPQPLTARGFAWQKSGTGCVVSPNSLAARILCDRHNPILSDLDAAALRLFTVFQQNSIGPHFFNGHDIERWLLKVMAGALYSGSLVMAAHVTATITARWMRILFGLEDFGPGEGLYVSSKPASRQAIGGVEFSCFERDGNVVGAMTKLCGRELILSMEPLEENSLADRTVVYRPLEIHTQIGRFDQSILFSWDGQSQLGSLHLRLYAI